MEPATMTAPIAPVQPANAGGSDALADASVAMMLCYAVLAQILQAKAIPGEGKNPILGAAPPHGSAAAAHAPTPGNPGVTPPSPVLKAGDDPSVLDPGAWGLELLGIMAAYDLLAQRYCDPNTPPDEKAWLLGQMNDYALMLGKAQFQEQWYESQHGGKTYLDPTLITVLYGAITVLQAIMEPGGPPPSVFSQYWGAQIADMAATQPPVTILDWIKANVKQIPGSTDPEYLKLAAMTSILFADLDDKWAGELGGIDDFFNYFNPDSPFFNMAGASAESIAYYMWFGEGQPKQGDPNWASFQNDLKYMQDVFDPSRSGSPQPAYTNKFFAHVLSLFAMFSSGTPPYGDTIADVIARFFDQFNPFMQG